MYRQMHVTSCVNLSGFKYLKYSNTNNVPLHNQIESLCTNGSLGHEIALPTIQEPAPMPPKSSQQLGCSCERRQIQLLFHKRIGKEEMKHIKRTPEKAVRLNQTRSGNRWQRIASLFQRIYSVFIKSMQYDVLPPTTSYALSYVEIYQKKY